LPTAVTRPFEDEWDATRVNAPGRRDRLDGLPR